MRELANNPAQKRNSQYARNFQKKDAHKKLTAPKAKVEKVPHLSMWEILLRIIRIYMDQKTQ